MGSKYYDESADKEGSVRFDMALIYPELSH